MAGRIVSRFIQDLHYSFRLIRKSPWFALAVIAPLALGIGLNGAIFLLVDALLLRPLPVKDPQGLVLIAQNIRNVGVRSYYSYDALRALQQKSASFTEVFGTRDWNTAVRDAGGARRVRLQLVTGNFFSSLGVGARHGRILTPADEHALAGTPPAVLSYPYWQSAFHGEVSAIGRTMLLEGRAFTIAGIMPRSFNGIQLETTPDVRIPDSAGWLFSRDAEDYKYDYTLAGRLKPGVGLETARAETESIVNATLDSSALAQRREERIELHSLTRGMSLIRPKFTSALILLMGGVALLLLMICANAGGLLLARASSRREEMAVRLAMGASSARLTRQWLTESAVLAGIGALLGLCLASAITPLLVRAMPPVRDAAANELMLSLDIQPDSRLLVFAILLCGVCTLFAGMPAALQARRTNLQNVLRETRGSLRQPLRWALVTSQVALCTFLLAGAMLLIATFRNLRAMDPGFDRDHVATFSVDPSMLKYTPRQAADLRARLTNAVRTIPGVQSAAIARIGLMHGTGMKTTAAPMGQRVDRTDFMNTSLNWVSPEYFETMGIQLLAGRNFRSDEPDAKPAPAIVNQAFVRRFFPTADPIGQRFGTGAQKVAEGTNQIVGVVGDAKYRSLRESIPPTIYHFASPAPASADPFILHVRARGRPDGVMRGVEKALSDIDPRLPFYEVRTLAQEVDATLWAERMLAWLSGLFGAVATVLAIMGIYATLAYAVAQSKREIGIRVALGARAADVLRLFSARPLRFVSMGVVVGIGAFYAITPAFRSVLYEVSATDPTTLAVAAAGVLFIALAATLVAAGGALRVDPASLLREE